MRLLIIVLITVMFSSCAKESHQDSPAATAVESAPSCVLYLTGSRTFCNGVNTTASAYDCGMHDGKRCWKYIHTPDSNDASPYEDFVCVEPFSSGDECANKLP